MAYRAVLFDLFGTLVDPVDGPAYWRLLERIAGILGVPADDFRTLWRQTSRDRFMGLHPDQRASFVFITDALGVPVTEAQLDEAARLRYDYGARTLEPRPDTIPTIEAIRRAGLKTALISNCSGEVPVLWRDSLLEGLFDATVFSCQVGLMKPDPHIYRLVLDRFNMPPDTCLYVGDGAGQELTGASELGMRAVLIRDPADDTDSRYASREDDWSGDRIGYLSELLPLLGLDVVGE